VVRNLHENLSCNTTRQYVKSSTEDISCLFIPIAMSKSEDIFVVLSAFNVDVRI